MSNLIRCELPDKAQPLFEPRRYKILHGGRGSSKSWTVARVLIIRASERRLRILCAREVQRSIHESVYQLLENQISAMGLAEQFEFKRDAIINRITGSEFVFAGLRSQDVGKIKSFEGADICWVEEAQTVSDRSWMVLIPTLRKPGSEIWVTFNPEYEEDATYQRFVLNPPDNSTVIEMNWQDNPWLSEELRAEKDYLLRTDPDSYEHVWGGKCITGKSGFFKRDWFRWYERKPAHLRIYMASDFAVTDGEGDFTEHGVFGVDPDDNVFVLDWWFGQTAADIWIDSLLDLVDKWKPVTWYGEAGVIRRAVEPFLAKRMRERRSYCHCEWLPSIHDKPTRARGIQARCSAGKLYFLEGSEWTERLITQLLRFPGGHHDDGVDVMSLIGRALEDMVAAVKPVKQVEKEADYTDYDDSDDDWKTA